MKRVSLAALAIIPLFSSCDHIDAVGNKVNDLKELRMESSQGIDGLKLGQIADGINGGPTVQDVAQTDFDAFISEPGRMNIVDFHAEWCGPCKNLGPVLSGVVEANSGVARLGKINVDHARELSQSQDVRSIPDVRFYIEGKMVHRFVGGESKSTLEQLVKTHTASIVPVTDFAGQLNTGLDGVVGDAPAAGPAGGNHKAKPIAEAMQPMEKEWLPPGMSRKK